ncbi:MAG: ASKHA domain-containing protein [Deltaproteobacteria bacterium]|jgi:uncharacterized 2Fe-2S/4Fe-4S cluster protein (DUF4445 family)|nr:ASKHA domain-containing protein [Deltaproteobacteria bacterium]
MIAVEGFGHLEVRPGQSLLEALTEAGVSLESACGGKGLCGKCLAKITQGAPPPPQDEEIKLVDAAKLAAGYRLACLLRPLVDLTVSLPDERKKARILTAGQTPDFEFSPSIRKVCFRIPQRAIVDNQSAEEWLGRLDKDLELQGDLAFLKTLAPLKLGNVSGEKSCTAVFHQGRPLLAEPGDTTNSAYGLALDIGTTTVVLSLIDLTDGRELGSASMINPQTAHGLDVLSRIAYAQENGRTGLDALQSSVVGGVEQLALSLCRERGLEPTSLYQLAAAGNATMLHLFLGLAPDSLGLAPFAPTLTRRLSCRGAELGFKELGSTSVFCLPSVSAYIGADIVAGAYVCRLKSRRENILFIDIGTNGEVILSEQGRMISCSCAAGPAFEGMNISRGMRAAEGAVEDVRLKMEQGQLSVELKIIGDVAPAGFCGSGVMAAARELLKIGLVRPNGSLAKKADLPADDPRRALCLEISGKPAVRLSLDSDDLVFTQKDVRQIQLAKGAILSAIRALLAKAGLDMSALDRVIVAGQFGAYLSAESLTGCGVIPEELGEKLKYAGNTSKVGAYMALMSSRVTSEMDELAGEIDYFELGGLENYDRLFASAMRFPEPKKD